MMIMSELTKGVDPTIKSFLEELNHSILDENEEKWTFSFNPENLSDYLNKFDLTLLEDMGSIEYRKQYMSERRNLLEGYEFYRVAFAVLDK
jgi:hypothetical protein